MVSVTGIGSWADVIKIIGGGGILAILILREVLPYFKNHGNQPFREKPVNFWENKLNKLEANLTGIMNIQTSILSSQTITLAAQTSTLTAQTTLLDEIRKGQEQINERVALILDRTRRPELGT